MTRSVLSNHPANRSLFYGRDIKDGKVGSKTRTCFTRFEMFLHSFNNKSSFDIIFIKLASFNEICYLRLICWKRHEI